MPLPLPHDLSMEMLAEDALLLRFGESIALDVNARVHAAASQLQARLDGIECVPAYASLLLRFDPMQWIDIAQAPPWHRLGDAVAAALADVRDAGRPAREVSVPVWYDDEAGPDLPEVAEHAGLGVDEVIARHCAGSYRVAMLGFAPGFPYLLGLDPALAMPRRVDPRLGVPAGSVAIGGSQTGIYPQVLPGGWHLIGRTPLALFDAHADAPSLLQPGDRVRFQPIDRATWQRLARERV